MLGWLLNLDFAGSLATGVVIAVSERYAIDGIDNTRLTLDGAASARLSLDGIEDSRLTLVGTQ